jgi:adenylosuccinate lyase
MEDTIVSSKLSETEIDYALNPKNYTGTAAKQAERFAQT